MQREKEKVEKARQREEEKKGRGTKVGRGETTEIDQCTV